MRHARWMTGLMTIAIVVELTPAAQAQSRYEIAQALAATAIDMAKENRFEEALGLLDNAYRRDPVPVLMYNMGRVNEKKGDLPEAKKAYERYLAEEKSDTEGIAKARELLAGVMRQLPRTLRISSDRPGARIFVDGQEVAQVPMEPMTFDIGEHDVMIRHCGYVTERRRVNVPPAEATVVSMPLKKAPAVLAFVCEGSSKVRIDQEPFGQCPMQKTIELKPAKYIMEFFSDTNERTLQMIEIQAGVTLHARFNAATKAMDLRFEGECVDAAGKPIPVTPRVVPVPPPAVPILRPADTGAN